MPQTDPRLPLKAVTAVSFFEVPQEAHGAICNRRRMIGCWLRHAGYREIGVANGLDPLYAELLADPVKSSKNVVQLAKRDCRVVGLGKVRKPNEIEHEYRDISIKLRRDHTERFIFFVNAARH